MLLLFRWLLEWTLSLSFVCFGLGTYRIVEDSTCLFLIFSPIVVDFEKHFSHLFLDENHFYFLQKDWSFPPILRLHTWNLHCQGIQRLPKDPELHWTKARSQDWLGYAIWAISSLLLKFIQFYLNKEWCTSNRLRLSSFQCSIYGISFDSHQLDVFALKSGISEQITNLYFMKEIIIDEFKGELVSFDLDIFLHANIFFYIKSNSDIIQPLYYIVILYSSKLSLWVIFSTLSKPIFLVLMALKREWRWESVEYEVKRTINLPDGEKAFRDEELKHWKHRYIILGDIYELLWNYYNNIDLTNYSRWWWKIPTC